MNQELTIKVTGTQSFMGMKIPVVLGGFGPEARCICDKTAAEIHGMEPKNIRARITDNIKRFVENIDYIDMKIVACQTSNNSNGGCNLLASIGYTKMEISKAEHIYILSERGYFKLVKILNSDQAWDVYENLLSDYFSMREEQRELKGKTAPAQKGMTDYQQQNIHIQKAKLLEKIAAEYEGTYRQILHSYATKELTGEHLLPLPQLEARTYSATEIGEMLGISANKVGRLAIDNNLKTDQYGEWFKDKSRYSSKEVPSFRYYESIIPVLRRLLSQSEDVSEEEI